jgi:hypothetical protein
MNLRTGIGPRRGSIEQKSVLHPPSPPSLNPPDVGLPGVVAPRNITPDKETGIGNWTDGEKIRAIREGISRDGTTLFPMMGYERFRHMSDEDVYSLSASRRRY